MANEHVPSLSARQVLERSDAFSLIDVRKLAAAQASGKRVAGARYVDPFALGFDHAVLQSVDPLVFYCVHGHEVSMFACALARVAGREAHYVEGGFLALVDAGADLVPFRGESA
ncbi:MAG: rhodanese-like domain-containing protein [Pseudomonadota bacterium]